jgi:hypothetical protein
MLLMEIIVELVEKPALQMGVLSSAEGYYVSTNKYGQYAHSSSNLDATPGNNQYSRVVYAGESVGGSSVTLTSADSIEYILESNKSYSMKITIVTSQSAGVGPGMFVYDVSVSVDNSGIAVLNATNLSFSYNPIGYVVNLSVQTGPFFRIDFIGTGGVNVRAVATIEATELLFV